MLKSCEHSLENWLIPGLGQGKYKKSIKHLAVLDIKKVLKTKGHKPVKMAREPESVPDSQRWKNFTNK